ncbi:Ankyrin repeat and MYND domain-containing protein 2 [Armadillidium nasatum]|uniref:Ankyrin repeat and MYND domain-containing protein 2 n=1 Tax=Armadillidium nasatum TaxID=96803 RepID=A0A5N5TDC6_9CRUS|nr:Ankyrin repeat and MYND domain-containing protein 2 [Armadillidium nasatum]
MDATNKVNSENGESSKEVPEIIQYVNSNDLKEVKNILVSGKAKIETQDENGMTPLHHASYKGQYEMCKLLIDFGADVNADSHDHGYSPLHFAALSGSTQTVQLLLSSGAKIYHTNTLKRTPAQMAGFVGNHVIVALINNYLPLSSIEYYTKPQGLETESKLPPHVSKPLYDLIMQTNLHPVYTAMIAEKNLDLLNNLDKCSKVLSLMCEKEAKRSENVNEKSKTNEEENEGERNSRNENLFFEPIIKKWLIGKASDGFQEHLEFYVRDAIKAFPYVEMPLFLQVVRNVHGKSGESWALDVLHGVINGPKGFDDGITCFTCGLENKNVKKCAKCKSVQYCNKTCQRLHWSSHKKVCAK